MAHIYPSFDQIEKLKVPPTSGEETLLRLLYDSLDNRFEIYFQPYLGGDRPDVILVNKESGIMIFEVKDWELKNYRIRNDENWALVKDGQKIKSPFQQVNNYRTNMINLCILFNISFSYKFYFVCLFILYNNIIFLWRLVDLFINKRLNSFIKLVNQQIIIYK